MSARPPKQLLCPSAQPDLPGAVVFALVDHTGPEPAVAYLDEVAPIEPELLELTKPLRPTEVFRIAAPCQEKRCSHWGGSACQLVGQLVQLVPPSTLTLPTCMVRHSCRWYADGGRDACLRCTQIVTQNMNPSEEVRIASQPLGPAAEPTEI